MEKDVICTSYIDAPW